MEVGMSDAQNRGPLKARIAYYRDRLANGRALRAERRGRDKGDFTDAARKAESSAQTKGGYFTK
jgi:hypothetical protein